jgi:hypothetical protein
MKKIIASAAMLILVAGCEQEDILRYDPSRAATAFRNTSSVHTFALNRGLPDMMVEIPFNIEGYTAPYERTAVFGVQADNTTATNVHYEILDATVPADSWTGTLRVKLFNHPSLNDGDVVVTLQTADGGDFVAGTANYESHALTISNRLQRPVEWTVWVARNRLGTYSTAYYAFIIEATGYERFAINTTIPGIYDTPWTSGFVADFLILITKKLNERNDEAGSMLLHDDGPAEGLPVIVGRHYETNPF